MIARVLLAAVAALTLTVGAARAGDGAARIVSIGGSVTEILYALGVGDRVVAVDSTSSWPASVGTLPNVGYMRRLAAEPVVALAPRMVIAEADAGPESALDLIAAAGVRVIRVPDTPTVAGIEAKIRAVAGAVNRRAAGERLIAVLNEKIAAARKKVGSYTARPRVLFVLSTARGAMLAGGRETSAAAIIELAGGTNAISGFTGFKPLSPEAALAAAPDIVLVTEHGIGIAGGPAQIMSRPDIAATPAGRAGRLVAMDGLLLLGFGPRTGEAVEDLAAAIHASGQ